VVPPLSRRKRLDFEFELQPTNALGKGANKAKGSSCSLCLKDVADAIPGTCGNDDCRLAFDIAMMVIVGPPSVPCLIVIISERSVSSLRVVCFMVTYPSLTPGADDA
jgi:hypothetical protein